MSPLVAVIGNVDWTDYVPLGAVPEPGRRLRSEGAHEGPGATAPVVAVQLVKLGAEVDLYTILGDDLVSARLESFFRTTGVALFATRRPGPLTRSLALLDLGESERSLIALGERASPSLRDALPWHRLDSADAVVFANGDEALLAHARAATPLLIVHALAAEVLTAANVRADILVGSALDEEEARHLSADASNADLIIETLAEAGGRYVVRGRHPGTWDATPLPGPMVDSYGCGASFIGGLTWGLLTKRALEAAIELGAECGAACLTGQGPFGAQLRF